jgi:para-nitrobenzyl esterase
VNQSLAPGLAGGTVSKNENAPKPPEPVGAPHACEIEYCMGNLDLVKEYAWTADDYKVSETMLNYFANFIISGNPNGKDLPDWPASEGNDPAPPVMIIDVQSHAVKAKDDSRYVFLDKAFKNN